MSKELQNYYRIVFKLPLTAYNGEITSKYTIKHITNARISCLFSFHSYLSISYRLDTLILTVGMSSQKKEPLFNKKIVQSIDTTDLDGILALAGKFLFVAPCNITAAAMQMAWRMKEE